jgi:predicted metal-dependent hydrolase
MSPRVKVGADVTYRVEFRKARAPSVEFDSGQMTLVLPKGDSPEQSVQEHAGWIGRVHAGVQAALRAAHGRELEDRSQAEFRQLVWRLAEAHAKTLGVEFYKIYFKRATEKWASCGTDGNITVNTLMRRLPERLVDYIMYHEVAHRREMDHGKAFQRIIARRYPDRAGCDMELYVYWLIVNRVA